MLNVSTLNIEHSTFNIQHSPFNDLSRRGTMTTGVRITAGTLRGRRIAVPSRDVRPTSERARQAYFNIVGDRIHGARFLDLFAGSGVFSFEAISRGAASALAVDRKTKDIERTAKEWNVPVRTMAADVLSVRIDDEFDLVYADPPYDFERYDDLLLAIDRMKLADGALVAVEHRARANVAPAMEDGRSACPDRRWRLSSSGGATRLAFRRRAEYGEVWITFFEVPCN
jgi:16S rRNA (guanine966-N2)-methyltransferase